MSHRSSLGIARKGHWRKKPVVAFLDTLPETPVNWTKQQNQNSVLYLCTFISPLHHPVITHSVTIRKNGTWSTAIHGQDADHHRCPSLSAVPDVLAGSSDAISLLSSISGQNVCTWNPDEKFIPLAETRKGVFKKQSGDATTAFLDKTYPVQEKTGTCWSTICTIKCQLLVGDGHRCSICSTHRSSLITMLHRLNSKALENASDAPGSTNPQTNLRYMNTPEKQGQIKALRIQVNTTGQENRRLEARLASVLQQSSVMIDNTLSDDIVHLSRENSKEMDELMPPDSPAWLLWEQQQCSLSLKSAKGNRWNLLIIRFCLSLKLKSPAAYHTLRENGLLILPSERTLRDYTHYIQSGPGFHVDVEKQLFKSARLDDSPPYQRSVVLAIDEMKVKQDLVFNKHTRELIGFVDLGDADTALQTLISSEANEPSVALHMLVIMIRFLFKKLNFIHAIFPISVATAPEIYSILWEGVG